MSRQRADTRIMRIGNASIGSASLRALAAAERVQRSLTEAPQRAPSRVDERVGSSFNDSQRQTLSILDGIFGSRRAGELLRGQASADRDLGQTLATRNQERYEILAQRWQKRLDARMEQGSTLLDRRA